MNKKLLVVVAAAAIVFLNQILSQYISPAVQVPASVAEDVVDYIVPEKDQETREEVEYKVLAVIDGDTIDVEVNGVSKRVRYIGIDTPEIGHDGKVDECFAVAAKERNEELLADGAVRLVKDVSEVDQYGRLLRYVYTGEVMINERLVEEGYARLVTFPPDVEKTELFRGLERTARAEELGLWGGCL